MKEHLLEFFGYDFWANSRWIEYLASRDSSAEELEQMAHLLGSQRMWITRVCGVSPTEFVLPEPTLETLQDLNQRWKQALESRELNEVIDYQRTTGEALSLTVKQIASHVINHGTYHRGVLRGIALNQDRWDFPDTDLAGFYTGIV
ncbi:MAG: DinB family protein [Armatimonadota bacterium]